MPWNIQLGKHLWLRFLLVGILIALSFNVVGAGAVAGDRSQAPTVPAACDPLPPGATAESQANSMIVALNQWRVANGYTVVAYNAQLASAALAHSQDMSQNNYVNHTGRDGSSPGQRATTAGYNWQLIGENLEAGLADAAAIIERWWRQSPSHLHVMQMPVREVGVGYVYDPNDQAGVDLGDGQIGGPYCHYWTLMVGTRAQVYPVVINRGAAATNSRNVMVTIGIGSSASLSEAPFVRFAAQPLTPAQWDGVPWIAFTGQEIPFTLPAGDGVKTVYGQVKLMNALPWDAVSATIRLATASQRRVYLPAIRR